MSRAHVSADDEARGVVLACRVRPLSSVELTVLGSMNKALMRNPLGWRSNPRNATCKEIEMTVMRIGHIDIRVMDMAAALKHYENVVGMKATHTDAEGRVYLKCWDEWDKYSVILTPSDSAGMNHVAYKVEKDADLDKFAGRIREYGIASTSCPKARCAALRAHDAASRCPAATRCGCTAQKEFVGTDVGSTNPSPGPTACAAPVPTGSITCC
jgi:predicted enzyme related to lactoylglutathione lyase